jgi:hypothetical protein
MAIRDQLKLPRQVHRPRRNAGDIETFDPDRFVTALFEQPK